MVVGSGELLVSGSIMHSEPMTMLAIAKMMNGMDWFTILPWKNNSNEGKWLKKKKPQKKLIGNVLQSENQLFDYDSS